MRTVKPRHAFVSVGARAINGVWRWQLTSQIGGQKARFGTELALNDVTRMWGTAAFGLSADASLPPLCYAEL